MSRISYKVTRGGDQWALLRNGEDDGSFVTQEAAFETAAAHAGGDLRSGYAIVIEAAPATDPAGASDRGGTPMRGDGFSS